MSCSASVLSSSSLFEHPRQSITWTEEENKMFESALPFFDEYTPNRWNEVASMTPGKSVYDVMNQYKELVSDVSDIEAGLVCSSWIRGFNFTWEIADHHHSFDVTRNEEKAFHGQQRSTGEIPYSYHYSGIY